MNTGLTIAFICNGDTHPTTINYKKFGNHYWDDTQNNNSKIGYYFAYYFQQKYVYIHKIINILQPNERPSSMIWESNRQILCLSKQLKKFTWNEWITGIGLGSPYTPTYRMTQTGSWSCSDLQNHQKYHTFNFINFQNIIEQQPEQQPVNITTISSSDNAVNDMEDDIDDDEILFQKERKRKAEERMAQLKRLQDAEDEEDNKRLQAIKAKKIAKNVVSLREIKRDELLIERSYYQDIIDEANVKLYKMDEEIRAIMRGERDTELIKQKTDNIKLNI
jgi:hypothetical protein